MSDELVYRGLTKGELVAALEHVPDDAPIYVPVDDGCFGLARVEAAWYIPDEDHAEHTGIMVGVCLIDADLDGAQECPFDIGS